MVKVGTISIDLVAHTGKLLKPLKQAEAAVAGLAGKFLKFGGIAAAITAPLAGLLSVHTAVNRVKKALTELDDAGKASDRLGITTEKLLGLQHAADLAGVSAEQLQTALEYMLRKGFSVDDLGRMADEMVAITNPMERMQWIFERFGRSGAGMINVLGAGSAGLKAMQRDAEKLGLTFSRLDAAKVEEANDAFARIGKAMDGLARTMAVQLAPHIENLSNKLVDFATNSEIGLKQKIPEAVDWCITKVGELGDTINWMGQQWEVAKFGLAAFSVSLDAAIKQANANLRELGNFISYVFYNKMLGRTLAPYDKLGANAAQEALQAFVLESGSSLERWAEQLSQGKPKRSSERGAVDGGWQSRSRFPTPVDMLSEVENVIEKVSRVASVSMIGALEAGSVSAMSAIAQTQRKPIEDQQLKELKDIAINTDRILDDAVILRRANLA